MVCLDATGKPLSGEVRVPLPLEPGPPARIAHASVRNGVAQIFVEVEPLSGQRHVQAGERRRRRDGALWIAGLLETRCRQAERVVLVPDNWNSHGSESLWATFPPEQARRLAERLAIHDTPKHGSWLNMAEIELSALCRHCLHRRIADLPRMQHEITAWEADRRISSRRSTGASGLRTPDSSWKVCIQTRQIK